MKNKCFKILIENKQEKYNIWEIDLSDYKQVMQTKYYNSEIVLTKNRKKISTFFLKFLRNYVFRAEQNYYELIFLGNADFEIAFHVKAEEKHSAESACCFNLKNRSVIRTFYIVINISRPRR